jgi:hypothetical protein
MKEIIHHEGSFGQGLGTMVIGFFRGTDPGDKKRGIHKKTRVQVTIKKAFGRKRCREVSRMCRNRCNNNEDVFIFWSFFWRGLGAETAVSAVIQL